MTTQNWNELYDARRRAIADAQSARAEAIADALIGLGRVVGKVLSYVFAPLGRLVERERLRAELNQLDDRLLADIGLARDDVSRVVRGQYFDSSVTPLVSDQKLAEPANAFRPSRAA